MRAANDAREDALPGPEPARRGDWMQTYTGRAFWPLDPKREDLDIVDIAHALSLQCRFNGHCRGFYSVADHSLRVAAMLTGEARLFGLLHDAGEAYIGDIVRPLKGLAPRLKQAEEEILALIFQRFSDRHPTPREWGAVKLADAVLLATEARDLMGPPAREWEELPPPLPDRLFPHGPPETVEQDFLATFAEYGGRP